MMIVACPSFNKRTDLSTFYCSICNNSTFCTRQKKKQFYIFSPSLFKDDCLLLYIGSRLNPYGTPSLDELNIVIPFSYGFFRKIISYVSLIPCHFSLSNCSY
jgi:hypothetical protein